MKRQRWTTGIRRYFVMAALGFWASSAGADLFVGSGPVPSQVVRYDNSGNVIGVFVSADNNLNTPRGLAFGPDGNLYICSVNSNQVLRYDGTAGVFLEAFVPAGSGGLTGPEVAIFRTDGFLYVSNFGTSPTTNNQGMQVNALDGQVTRYDATTGTFDSVFASSADVRGNVDGMAFGPNGDLFVTAFNRNSPDVPGVLRFDGMSGAFISQFTQGTNLFLPRDATFGPDGNLYVADIGNNAAGDSRVARFDGTTGQYIDDFIPFGSGLYVARGLAFGPDGRLYASGESPDANQPYGLIWAFDGTTLSIFVNSNADGSNLILPTHFVFSP